MTSTQRIVLTMQCVVCLTSSVVCTASAQSVPPLVNYQGQLAGSDATPLRTGDYVLEFRIFDAASSGTLVWGPQTFNGQGGAGFGPMIPVVQGWFNVMLGPSDQSGRSLTSAFDAATRFIEVRIGSGVPITPRQQLISAPFALKAGEAVLAENSRKLAGFDWSSILENGNDPTTGRIKGTKLQPGSITSDLIGPGAVVSSKVAIGAIGTDHIADGSVTASKLGVDALGFGMPAGAIIPYAGANPPVGWRLCDGITVSRTTYSSLFQAIGTTYGAGDGTTTFNLPDLRGRTLVGLDSRQIEFDVLGEQGGEKTHTLLPSEMPTHTHTTWLGGDWNTGNGNGNGINLKGQWVGKADEFKTPGPLANAGGDQPHNNLQPYHTIHYLIKY